MSVFKLKSGNKPSPVKFFGRADSAAGSGRVGRAASTVARSGRGGRSGRVRSVGSVIARRNRTGAGSKRA